MACSDGDSFTIDSDVTYEDSLSFDGCYEASADTFNSETQYFLDGDEFIGYPGIYSSSSFDDDGDEHVSESSGTFRREVGPFLKHFVLSLRAEPWSPQVSKESAVGNTWLSMHTLAQGGE